MLVPPDRAGIRALVEKAPALERNGLDVLWVGEPYGFDAPTTLAYLAARTSRVHLGSGILPVHNQNPMTAMMAAGVDFRETVEICRKSRATSA
jgi:alkanesulfonate monooxygenase SsuD/methylene tetrahydromethanopterin reductase-like flavin-dependent oxidoreductase (luciferase family)